MKIQDWLRQNDGNLELLEQQLSIKTTCHEDGRCIFNYSQINSPKQNPIVMECRGLVLDMHNNWVLVARSFSRFFNYTEVDQEFYWNNCIGQEKLDGSLIILYYWKNKWRINTRGSFGQGEINYSGLTWDELIRPLFDESILDKQYTYVCEFVSPYNKIVQSHSEPALYLLTIFNGEHELKFDDYTIEAYRCEFKIPYATPFFSIGDVKTYVELYEKDDPTFEGVVLRDDNNNRIKVKSLSYCALHRICNNGDPCHPKNIIPLILTNEVDEIICYFNEIEPYVNEVKELIEKEKEETLSLWDQYRHIEGQKEFALSIKHYPHAGVLFKARKLGVDPLSLMDSDYFVKYFMR